MDNNNAKEQKPQSLKKKIISYIPVTAFVYFWKKPELIIFILGMSGFIVGYIIKNRFKGKFKVLMIFLEIIIIIGLIIIFYLLKDSMPDVLRKILFFTLEKDN